MLTDIRLELQNSLIFGWRLAANSPCRFAST
jgi:hypothetical protein